MAQASGFWTTTASPSGHQVANYTQALLSQSMRIVAACHGAQGVASGYGFALVGSGNPTGGTDRKVRIGTGAALVDGKWFENDASVDLTLDVTANLRCDRVTLRANWSTFTVSLVVIKGTDGSAAAPSIPAAVPGSSVYIPLCQALLNSSGGVTITDERSFALVGTGDLAAGAVTEPLLGALAVTEGKIGALAVTNGKIGANAVTAGKLANGAVDTTARLANDIVDDTKVGNRVPQFIRRQGSDASNWALGAGTLADYAPGAVRIQAGAFHTGLVSSGATYNQTITFPLAFSNYPLVFVTVRGSTTAGEAVTWTYNPIASSVAIYVKNNTGASNQFTVSWLAIGPE